MVLTAACAGAAGVLYWLRGANLGQMRDRAKHAVRRAEENMGQMVDEMSSAAAYPPDA